MFNIFYNLNIVILFFIYWCFLCFTHLKITFIAVNRFYSNVLLLFFHEICLQNIDPYEVFFCNINAQY